MQGSPFAQAFDANIEYLMRTFSSADNLLYWFRARAGQKNPKGARSLGWDRSGPDQPYGLKGSIAGLFMMGSGGVLRPCKRLTSNLRRRAHLQIFHYVALRGLPE